jgi:hypothetical protein
MTGSAEAFLQGEKLLVTKSANAVIKLSDLHLSPLPVDHLMPLVNMRGKEAIGGKLELTNYRLLFVSHAANRVTGKFSVLLPTIQGLRDASRFFAKKLEVQTATQTYEFVVWGVPQLIAQIEGAKAALSEGDVLQIARLVLQSAQVPGFGAADAEAFATGARNWLAAVPQDDHRSDTPFELASLLNAVELVSSLTGSGSRAPG